MSAKRTIAAADVMAAADYAKVRKQRRAEMMEVKRHRRLPVGPNATAHFESYATMLYQIQEMLHIEKGGAEQLEDELRAYAPLVPRGNELVCTFMLEYEDPAIRARKLAGLGGIEETITLEFAGETVRADWERDVDRTTPEGKTSSIHFLHFPMTAEQAAKFRQPDTRVVFAIGHANYGHMAVMPEATRAELAGDL